MLDGLKKKLNESLSGDLAENVSDTIGNSLKESLNGTLNGTVNGTVNGTLNGTLTEPLTELLNQSPIREYINSSKEKLSSSVCNIINDLPFSPPFSEELDKQMEDLKKCCIQRNW